MWLALAVHFAAGLVSIAAGAVALAVKKGGPLHRRVGLALTWGMVVLGLTAVGIGANEERPGQVFGGLLAAYLVFSAMTTVKPLPAIGDPRAIRAGGLQGNRRLARHLWRMCFGLFIATGSFLLGQMAFIPEPLRYMPLMLALPFAPLLFLMYWLWRVRVLGRTNGMVVGAPPTP